MQIGDIGILELSSKAFLPFRAVITEINAGIYFFESISDVIRSSDRSVYVGNQFWASSFDFAAGTSIFTLGSPSVQGGYSGQYHAALNVNFRIPTGIDNMPIEVKVSSGSDHSQCEVVDNECAGKKFRYCRSHKVEV